MNTETCIFCKIAHHEIPADLVYEDDHFVAFLDINPVKKGHTLIIPKDHYRWIQDLPDDRLSEAFILAKKMIKAIKSAFACQFTQLVVEGNEVPHFHISIVPGYEGQLNATFFHEAYAVNESKEYVEKVKRALESGF